MLRKQRFRLELRENHTIFKEEILKRRIKILHHATYSAALSAIDYTGGLWSRKRMQVPPFRLPHPNRPLDGLPRVYHDYLCLSIKPFRSFVKRQIKYTKNSVCVILIDSSIIQYEGVAFSPCVTNDEKFARAELKNTSIEDFRTLFLNNHSGETVCPSSKILVPAHISKSFFRGIVFATKGEMERALRVMPVSMPNCYCDSKLFPASALDDSKKINWPDSAEEIYNFWMEFLGIGI